MTSLIRPPFFHTIQGAIVGLLAYSLTHVTMRLLASSNLGENDPDIVLETQSFQTVLDSGAPVFDLIAFALIELFGPSAALFQVLRYGFLILSLIFVFLIARRVTGSGFWAIVTVESYALIYQLSWRFHEGFTHLFVGVVAVVGSFWALMVLKGWSKRDDQVAPRFGTLIFAAFILLGIYEGGWFLLYMASLTGALFLARAATPIMLVCLVGGLLVALWGHAPDMARLQVFEIRPDIASSVSAGLNGTLAALLNILSYVMPFVAILALMFGYRMRHHPVAVLPMGHVLAIQSALAFLLLLVAGFFHGQAIYPEYELTTVFFLMPIWLLDWVRRASPAFKLVKIYIVLCLVLMAVAFFARAANLYVLDPICRSCYFGIPFQGLAETLAAQHKVTQVMSDDKRLAGQLRNFWPETKPSFAVMSSPALIDSQMPVLLVWAEGSDHSKVRQMLPEIDADKLGAIISTAEVIKVPWEHTWRPDGYRHSTWRAFLYQPIHRPLNDRAVSN